MEVLLGLFISRSDGEAQRRPSARPLHTSSEAHFTSVQVASGGMGMGLRGKVNSPNINLSLMCCNEAMAIKRWKERRLHGEELLVEPM